MLDTQNKKVKGLELVAAALFLLIVASNIFSIHLEGDGIASFFGAIIFSVFPSYEEFRQTHWGLVELSQWSSPISALLMSLLGLTGVVICFKDKEWLMVIVAIVITCLFGYGTFENFNDRCY